ncbi:host-nuclease inhibitor Gam family protein [Leptospira santarosai]|uniref:Nuclease inhibitor n=1 Tax=Leptospira santarosai TaxID=28183 RepID=A0AB73NEJ6_9LEPT|nr:host-nuclease inhibitor Gam family protein [Leptospira santarosai]AVV50273.1 Gam-like protein [Leptospira santarosai]MDI7166911.1 host-nuclease inhibitor Gam family protein [Leptospira santarosai]ONF93352.1 nuclease inhibitor [Leptospira santarosai]UZN07544.1 host-nuclease inhibitor Gam family protein [Leptospira santarosai]
MSKSKNSLNKTNLTDLPNNHYKNRTDITQAIKQLGEIKRERDGVKNKVDDQISKILSDLQNEISPLDLKIQYIVSGIRFYVDRHPEEFFPDPEYKTCKLTTGTLKFRKVPYSVKTKGSVKFYEKILTQNDLLEKFNRIVSKLNGVYLRVRLELNKERILSEPTKAIQKIGIQLNEESERLYIVPSETELEIEVAEDVI